MMRPPEPLSIIHLGYSHPCANYIVLARLAHLRDAGPKWKNSTIVDATMLWNIDERRLGWTQRFEAFHLPSDCRNV